MTALTLIVPLSANAVYKCTTPQAKGSGNSGITYSSTPCDANAEKIDVGEESEWTREQRLYEVERMRNKTKLEQKWKDQEPTNREDEIAELKAKLAAKDAAMKAYVKKSKDEAFRKQVESDLRATGFLPY